MDFAEIYPILIALLIGALIGTERQRRLAEDKVRGVAGLRTFVLIALLGSLCATLANHYGPGFAIASLATFTILVAAGYASSVSTLGRIDFTAAVAAVVTFTLGMLTSFPDNIPLSVALAIMTTWVLATRSISHHYVEALSETDLLDTLKMGIIALVIYPLLPQAPLDPWSILNPRQIWLYVILVSLVGYVGYIMIRILGAERGLSLTGVLGGLVSSTAVTSAMAIEVKENKEMLPSAVFATAIASCTMFPRMLFIVLVANRDLFIALLPNLLMMTVVGVFLAYLLVERHNPKKRGEGKGSLSHHTCSDVRGLFSPLCSLSQSSPASILARREFIPPSIVSGLADVDAITLTLSTLAKSTLESNVAVITITIAAITNTLVKLCITHILGTREFGNMIAFIFIPTVLARILSMFLF